jgi:hypothetical protein
MCIIYHKPEVSQEGKAFPYFPENPRKTRKIQENYLLN